MESSPRQPRDFSLACGTVHLDAEGGRPGACSASCLGASKRPGRWSGASLFPSQLSMFVKFRELLLDLGGPKSSTRARSGELAAVLSVYLADSNSRGRYVCIVNCTVAS